VRAVAPLYPGARTLIDGHPARLLRTRVLDATAPAVIAPAFDAADGRITVRCGGADPADLELEIDDALVGAEHSRIGGRRRRRFPVESARGTPAAPDQND
jgi:hypothetical protein